MGKRSGSPSQSDSIRDYVRRVYLEPARRRAEARVQVVAGDVHTNLGLRNRVPLVCNALRSRDLLSEARVRIVADDGPPSGQSTTVAITYELLPDDSPLAVSPIHTDTFLGLRGIARETFRELGGGEKFIKQERERFATKESE